MRPISRAGRVEPRSSAGVLSSFHPASIGPSSMTTKSLRCIVLYHFYILLHIWLYKARFESD